MKRVIISLGEGTVQGGYSTITIQLWDADGGVVLKREASLPPAPRLANLYREWRSLYSAYYQNIGWSLRLEVDEQDTEVPTFSQVDFEQVCEQLAQQLNRWLDTESFQRGMRPVFKHLHQSDEILVILETEEPQLRRLPWQLWHFFTDYPYAEIALSVPEYERTLSLRPTRAPALKILGILGNSTTLQGDPIDVHTDKVLIEQLPGAHPQFLVEPDRQALSTPLWEQGWDIFFFAGHSATPPTGETGHLYINQNPDHNRLSVAELEQALRHAIGQGLQLAIFNSCDSLGLAWDLAKLNIPQILAMREPLPDEVAQSFLKYFLQAMARGQSLYLAVREARHRLQDLETDYPCASWLPVICQNPAAPSLSWPRVHRRTQVNRWWPRVGWVLAASGVATGLVMGLRLLGGLERSELNTFDQVMRLRPLEQADDRLLIVTATPEDIQQQVVAPQNQASLSDHTLMRLLAKLQAFEPVTIGLDIYRDFPVDPTVPQLATVLRQNHIFGLCKVKSPAGLDQAGIAPPPEIPPPRIGFADAVFDSDGVLRRHLLSMRRSEDVTDPCTATNHLSLLVALDYLQRGQGIEWTLTPDQELAIGGVVLKELTPHTGGYQGEQTQGRQILLNYRARPDPMEIAETLTLTNILADQIPASTLETLKNRIILIGVTGSVAESPDYWRTPYSEGQPDTAGLFIQAHKVSQLLSAVLDQRPLLRGWSWWREMLWIWGWSGIAGLLVAITDIRQWPRSKRLWGVALCLVFVPGALFGASYGLLLQGWWVPLIPAAIGIGLTWIGYLVMTRQSSGPHPSALKWFETASTKGDE